MEPHVFPASFAQAKLWFLDQLTPGSPLYNVPLALHLSGALDAAVLGRALDTVVARHAVLRTTFAARDGSPVQVVAPSIHVGLAELDLGTVPPGERRAAAARLASEEALRPFDLAAGPLLRATLLRFGATEHVLVIVIHHIVFDGWSVGVLFREIAECYRALALGERPRLAPLPAQYVDYTVWQRQQLQSGTLEPELAYWRRQLAGVPQVIALPTDRSRHGVRSFPGAEQAFPLPLSLTESLKALSRQEGATLFMTLVAAFAVLLHRYTGQEDLIVGAPIAGRTRAEFEGLIGCFVNTLALRVDLAGDPPCRELLRRVRKAALGAYAHQELPFERVVEALNPERRLSHDPLVQVLLVLSVPVAPLTLPGLTVSPWRIGEQTAKFDLSLSLTESPSGLQSWLHYSTDLFDAATVARMLGHFQVLLEAIAADPDRRLSELPLLTCAERRQLLVEWNATTASYARDRCVHQLFEAQAARTPDAVALVSGVEQLTYAELNRGANRLARYLRRLGVGPEVRVGLRLGRSAESVLAPLAVLKAGGAYVPIDPQCPLERLRFLLEDSAVRVLVTESQLRGEWPEDWARAVYLDLDRTAIAEESGDNLDSVTTADNLAYVIYTSGSTGWPKGVMVEHGSLLNYVRWVNGSLLSETVRHLPLVSGLTFDASLKQLFAPLLRGGYVWVLPDEVVGQPSALLRALTAQPGTGLNCVPSLWVSVLDEIDSGAAPAVAANLTHLFLGGEHFDEELVTRSLKAFPRLEIWNLYGPTETTVNATAARIVPGGGVSIGGPIANTRLYVVDRRLQPVPVGVPGELLIGGAGVARGYLGRPALTAARFGPDPFGPDPVGPDPVGGGPPGARLYRTGDRVRRRADGALEFLGRLDAQVKLRGFRIEPGEVEAALGRHPGVRAAAVVARAAGAAGAERRLVAYVVPRPGGSLANAGGELGIELRRFLRATLPEYLVPQVFINVAALPLSPGGKVDREALVALPAPTAGAPAKRAEAGTDRTAPRTPVEAALAALWAELLGLERVGVQQDFFALGGHSLLAVKLFAQIERTFGRRLPLATLFQAPTIEHLATALDPGRRTGLAGRSLVALQAGGSRTPLFCVHDVDGTNLGYRQLVNHLGSDQPVYGFEAPLGPDGQIPLRRIEQMAADYLRELRAFQPSGPYLLAGYCWAGLVAFEMARQLRAAAQEVSLLAVIDTGCTGHRRALTLRTRVYRRLRALVHCPPRAWPGYLRAHAASFWEHHTSGAAFRLSVELGRPLLRAFREGRPVYEQAGRCFHVRPYAGRVTLFRTARRGRDLPDGPYLGWDEVARDGVELHELPGDHLSVLQEPHVRVLAAGLRACLGRVQRDATPAGGAPAER